MQGCWYICREPSCCGPAKQLLNAGYCCGTICIFSPAGGKEDVLLCRRGGVKGKLGLVELLIRLDFLEGEDRGRRLEGEGGRSFMLFCGDVMTVLWGDENCRVPSEQ